MGAHKCKHPWLKTKGVQHTCSCGRRYIWNGKHWVLIWDYGR